MATKNIYQQVLINSDLFASYCPVTENFSFKDAYQYIILAQEIHLKDLLGIQLYDDLLTKICDGTVLDDCYKNLIVAIAPALANLSVYYALPFIWQKIERKGITKLSSENSDPADLNDIKYLRTNQMDVANSFLGLLQKHLNDNQDCITLYFPPKTECGETNSVMAGITIAGTTTRRSSIIF